MLRKKKVANLDEIWTFGFVQIGNSFECKIDAITISVFVIFLRLRIGWNRKNLVDFVDWGFFE